MIDSIASRGTKKLSGILKTLLVYLKKNSRSFRLYYICRFFCVVSTLWSRGVDVHALMHRCILSGITHQLAYKFKSVHLTNLTPLNLISTDLISSELSGHEASRFPIALMILLLTTTPRSPPPQLLLRTRQYLLL